MKQLKLKWKKISPFGEGRGQLQISNPSILYQYCKISMNHNKFILLSVSKRLVNLKMIF